MQHRMHSPVTVVAWSKSYALGLLEIDLQHKVLFDLINDLWNHLVSNNENKDILRTISELEHYTISHFTAEETFMRMQNHPNFDQHKLLHDGFIARISAEKHALISGEKLSFEILTFLKDWLVGHILVYDRAYADILIRKKAKKEPTSAWSRFFPRMR